MGGVPQSRPPPMSVFREGRAWGGGGVFGYLLLHSEWAKIGPGLFSLAAICVRLGYPPAFHPFHPLQTPRIWKKRGGRVLNSGSTPCFPVFDAEENAELAKSIMHLKQKNQAQRCPLTRKKEGKHKPMAEH